MSPLSLIVLVALGAAEAEKPTVVPLYPKGAPGAVGDTDADKPTLTVFLAPPEKATSTAVIICPGGGYGGLAMTYEGVDVAAWFNQRGVSAFVLKYRLGPRYHHPAMLQDAQRAIRTVRANAEKYKIEPKRVGILGFSAGGHLASTAATQFDDGKPDAEDPIERVSCRPDFAVLCYPVIAMTGPYAHAGSRRNLLGDNPPEELVRSLNSHERVTAKTPPTFLFHTNEDAAVPAENSALFYMALRANKVPAEMHIYEKGRHGVGLALKDPILSNWPVQLEGWLNSRGLLKK